MRGRTNTGVPLKKVENIFELTFAVSRPRKGKGKQGTTENPPRATAKYAKDAKTGFNRKERTERKEGARPFGGPSSTRPKKTEADPERIWGLLEVVHPQFMPPRRRHLQKKNPSRFSRKGFEESNLS